MIKENDLFLTTQKCGDIPEDNPDGLGLYTKDTRFLSRMEFYINGEKPLLLQSSAEENYSAMILLTNKHMEQEGELVLWRESVELKRKRFIYEGVLYETIRLTNFSPKPVKFSFEAAFDSDFSDMFMVRGYSESTGGTHLPALYQDRQLTLRYLGADNVLRETRIQWDQLHSRIFQDKLLVFQLALNSGEASDITFQIAPILNGVEPTVFPKEEALSRLEASYKQWSLNSTKVETDLPSFNRLYERGLQDLRVLLTDVGYGMFPVAGLPIFAVPFGRDSLIAALQMLPANPQIAKGTLMTMAAYQGTKIDEWRDEEPGKIMHEIRYGELANLNQIPFTPYYGTIDATPLFLILLVEYYHWTGDLALLEYLLPNVERAIEWIGTYGDADRDGFVEYYQRSSKGIANQGWKDSGDSIVHESGDFGHAPLALVEVQGYVYQSKVKLAPILRLLGRAELAGQLEAEADVMRQSFNDLFWMEDQDYYAIALDAGKNQVRSVTSNPGHVLMSGIADPDKAAKVAERLTSPDLFSGYGIRTMSTRSSGYNPMSYHNGSVWPHDNSVCLIGLSRLGFKKEASTVMEGLLQAADCFEYNRLPELFCGYERSIGAAVPYHFACSPQAWAAGTPLVFLQAMLGIVPDPIMQTIVLDPVLPPGMSVLKVERLAVGRGELSLVIHSDTDRGVEIQVFANTTTYKLITSEAVLLYC